MKTLTKVLISSTILFSIAACSKKLPTETASQGQITCVQTANLVETTKSAPIECSGILTSKKMIKLSFKTGGIIARVYVAKGGSVKKGQVIAKLDMTEIASQVEKADLILNKAERDLKRVKNLYNDTVATLQQFQDATSAYEAALENKNIADFNLQYSAITAPDNGKVIMKLAEEHELVGPGMPVILFSVQGKDEWVIKTGVTDKDVIRIKKGDKAEARLDAFPGIVFPATVTQIAEAADPQSGTFEIEIAVNPGKVKFINGLVAETKTEVENPHPVTLVPPDAIVRADGNKAYVYVVRASDTTAKKLPVTIAYLEKNNVAVIEPINKYGAVVTKGASYIEDGEKINVVE